jgi:hypothetical protein
LNLAVAVDLKRSKLGCTTPWKEVLLAEGFGCIAVGCTKCIPVSKESLALSPHLGCQYADKEGCKAMSFMSHQLPDSQIVAWKILSKENPCEVCNLPSFRMPLALHRV